tara:strand:- start:899 stop:1369 length:471 start_codon:yes stop_codon:yes gene_type:complete
MSVKPINSEDVPAKKGQSIYPPPFSLFVAGRTKRKLGDVFGLGNFGVNHTKLEPGAMSALFHSHSKQDEFIYILEGTPTVKIGDEEYIMKSGECIGFAAGSGLAHQLVNNSDGNVVYLEIGDRTPNDNVEYPNDDIKASCSSNNIWVLTHKDGTPY